MVDELVELLNQMDRAYRSELRDTNELNFARFDAKLEQRLGEFRSEVRRELEEVRTEFRTALHSVRADLQLAIQTLKSDMLKWMFVFWATTALAVILRR